MANDNDFLKNLASQLSCPKNTEGIEVANMMHESNIGMTRAAITALQISDGDLILELGHGSCKHLPEILEKAPNTSYYGLEISELMQKQASEANEIATNANRASFHLYNGQQIPFPNQTFNKILTVNTIYFWKQPQDFIREIYRVLKPGGYFSIGFADKDFMESLPFTVYGFDLYSKEMVYNLAETAGLKIKDIASITEKIKSKTGDEVERLYYVALLAK
ncbi:class I SAM-dependent methyltransferase [Pedobacter sp. SL55]|uniref:class I SAM-dependent methyltransferase n=1 Tax=Pedobacter sp. SL55 TaxID=2995161 RepID=UPI00226E7E8F|nr:class I SAM-dependent methyltransferase [Pedobacter sp. SL55]WAC39195.1 class I SAM-dependent methyltransferase [Pedobacter sp. SL55]